MDSLQVESQSVPESSTLQRHKSDLLDMIFDPVPMGIAILDCSYRLLRYNPTWAGFVHRYTPSTAGSLAPGASLFHLAPGFARDVEPLLEEVLRGEVVRREGLRLESEGISSYWDVSLMPLTGSGAEKGAGEVEGIVLMATDATDRVTAQEHLQARVEERTRELEQRRRVAEGLRDMLAVLNSDRPLQETLDYIASEAGRLLNAQGVAIFCLESTESGEVLRVQASYNLAPAYAARMSCPVGHGVVGKAVAERRPFGVSDVPPVFSALSKVIDAEADDELMGTLLYMARRYHSAMAVPLIIKDEIYGGISLYYEEYRDFHDDDFELGGIFGDHAALAIENARLRDQALRVAVAAERNRLARDLHDSVTQTLFSASLIAEVLPRLYERDREEGRRRLEELRQLSRGALAEMRMLLLELRPASLVDVELCELLRQLAEATGGRGRLPIELQIEGLCKPPPDVQVSLYRIAQEALNNVARHARATHAEVRLRSTSRRIELRISDNGQGFKLGRISAEHLGLTIMRERAVGMGADLKIASRPGHGTCVTVAWRYPPAEKKKGEEQR